MQRPPRRSLRRDPLRARVTSTCPAAAFEQSRAAVFSAAPRNPSSTGTASPRSMPTPTGAAAWGRRHLLGANRLQLHGGSYRLVRRQEHGQRLVATQLDHAAAASLDRVTRQLGEPLGEPRSLQRRLALA